MIYNHASSILHCDIYQQNKRNAKNNLLSNNSHIVQWIKSETKEEKIKQLKILRKGME